MPNENRLVRVWDPLVRVFHWTLAAAFVTAYVLEDHWLALHVIAGYAVAGLVAFRLLWGFIGSRHARFSEFVKGPRIVWRYLGAVAASRARRHLGHNPAGGAMVMALLFSLVMTALSGLAVYGHLEFSGPLAGLLYSLPPAAGSLLKGGHEFFANLTVLLVVLHVAGVLVASLQHGEDLVRSMITGFKPTETQ
jgi:cytochrome b